MFKSKFVIPSIEQRNSQINLLQALENEDRRGSKEFLFPEPNVLHKRRPSAPVGNLASATQSEDDDSATFEVILINIFRYFSKIVYIIR